MQKTRMSIYRLTPEKVAELMAAGKAGQYCDGNGLYLVVGPGRASYWIYKYRCGDRLRGAGLGSTQTWSLDEAREKARECRRLRDRGIDPIAYLRARRNAANAKVIARYDAAEAAD
jgi:hypothetical protein